MNDKTITISITTLNKKDIYFILSNLEFDNSVIDYERDIITTDYYYINATFKLKEECRDALEKKYKSEISKITIERFFSLLTRCKILICNYSINEIVHALIKGYDNTKIGNLLYSLLWKVDSFNNTDFKKVYCKKEQEKEQYKVKEIYKQKSISIKE